MKRDWAVEMLRFFATVGIAVFHFEWIYIGHPIYFQHFYIFVEFFFVLSGFFLAMKMCKQQDELCDEFSSIHYMFAHAKKLFPLYLAGLIWSFAIYCICNRVNSFNSIVELLWSTKWEWALLQLNGIVESVSVNPVTGYIPAMLIGELLCSYLLRKRREFTLNILCPLAPIVIYSFIINTYGNLSVWTQLIGGFTIGIFRGLAGILVGIGSYYCGRHVFVDNGKASHAYLRVLGIVVCTGFVISLVVFSNKISYSDEVLYVYVFAILLACVYFRRKLKTVKGEKIILYSGKISYPIYLFHYSFLLILKTFLPNRSNKKMLILFVLIVIFVSIATEFVKNLFYHKNSSLSSG